MAGGVTKHIRTRHQGHRGIGHEELRARPEHRDRTSIVCPQGLLGMLEQRCDGSGMRPCRQHRGGGCVLFRLMSTEYMGWMRVSKEYMEWARTEH